MLMLLLLSEIGNTISSLFGGGSSSAEEADKVSPEGSPEETVPEVHYAVVVEKMSGVDKRISCIAGCGSI